MSGVDLVGQGRNLIAQGLPDLALRLWLSAPWPIPEPQLTALVEQGRARADELNSILTSVRETRETFGTAAADSGEAITRARDDLTTSAQQAGLLVTTILSDATNALYKDDAKRNEKESRGVWTWGLIVLGFAAITAILPVVLHYLNVGPKYSTPEVIGRDYFKCEQSLHSGSRGVRSRLDGAIRDRERSKPIAWRRCAQHKSGTLIRDFRSNRSGRDGNPVDRVVGPRKLP